MPDIEVGSVQQSSGRSCRPKCALGGRIKNQPTVPLQEAKRTSECTSRGSHVVPSGGLLDEDLAGEDKRKDGRGLLFSPSPPPLKRNPFCPIFSTHHPPKCLFVYLVPLSSISATFADVQISFALPRPSPTPASRPSTCVTLFSGEESPDMV